MRRFCRILGRCKAKFLNAMPDLMVIAGAVLIAYGCSLIYTPVAWIVAGAELLVGAVIWSRGYTGAGGDAL